MATKAQAKRRKRYTLAGVAVVTVILLLVMAKPWVRDRVVAFRIAEYASFIDEQAAANDLPAEYLRAIISAESGGDPQAQSHKNARGLMQITDAAESDVLRIHGFDKGDLFDPKYNIRVGAAYLRILADRFEGDLVLTTAAYHQGAARTQKLIEKHPDLSPDALIEQHANRTTAAYVLRVTDDLALNGDQSAGAPVTDE